MQHFKAQRPHGIARQLRDWPAPPVALVSYRTAEVTFGGMNTRGVDSAIMALKQQSGFHTFISKVPDVTAHLGG